MKAKTLAALATLAPALAVADSAFDIPEGMLSAEATIAMIEETGAFQVPMGDAGEMVFLRAADGSYRIVSRFHEEVPFNGCHTGEYRNSNGTFSFVLCEEEGWQAPDGFEARIAEGLGPDAFVAELTGTAPSDALPLPLVLIAVTFNVDAGINAALWDAQSTVLMGCRDPWGRATTGLELPALGINTERKDCRNAKRARMGQHLAAAEALSAEATAKADQAEARADQAAQERREAEASADQAAADLQRALRALEFIKQVNAALSD